MCDNFTLILQPQVAYFDKFNFSFQISHILRNECHNVKWPDEEWSVEQALIKLIDVLNHK